MVKHDEYRNPKLHAAGAYADGNLSDGYTDASWLLILETEGVNGMGHVEAYWAFETEADAERCNRLGSLMDALNRHVSEEIPEGVYTTEIMTYADFKASYGNRMPLRNFNGTE
jgi:hypothetical protein